jgi:arsenate reductase
MSDRIYNVLFLCTGNSARSIMAECALSRFGRTRFRAFSAGSRPTGTVNPYVVELLSRFNYDTTALRSKSWDEFAQPDSPPLDFVFTVCDRAREEACPLWPGQPMTAHWGVDDPAAFVGPEADKRRFVMKIYTELENRVKIFSSLRIELLDQLALQGHLDKIGRTRSE